MPDELINIIYISAATNSLSDSELLSILVPAKHYNERNNITGMLLYCDGHFIQVLEGSRETVTALFAKIQADERHTMVQKLIEATIEHRCFPDWSMGFHAFDSDELAKIEGYKAFITEFKNKGAVTKNARIAFQLLESFRQTMCRNF